MSQTVLCVLFTFLFCLLQVQGLTNNTTSTNGSTPQEPRFCSLPVNATTFTCDVESYSQSVLSRSIPGLAIALFFFFTLIIFLFTLCCYRCCSKKRTYFKRLDSKWIRFLMMMAPFLLLVVGSVMVIVAHFQIDPVFVYSVSYLEQGSDSIDKLDNDVNVTMTKIHSLFPKSPISTSQITQELIGVQSSFIITRSIVIQVQVVRIVLVSIAVSLACLVGLLGLGLCLSRHGCFFFTVSFLAFLLIVGSCIFIAVLAVLDPVVNDTCKEVNYKGGVIELVQSQAMTTYNLLQQSLESEINSTISQICPYFQEYCKQAHELCGTCNRATFLNFMNSTVINNGTKITLKQCNSTCTPGSSLKELASNYVNTVLFSTIAESLLLDVKNTLGGFFVPTTELEWFLCETETPIDLLYASCAFFLAGCAISGFFMLLIIQNRELEEFSSDRESLYQLTS